MTSRRGFHFDKGGWSFVIVYEGFGVKLMRVWDDILKAQHIVLITTSSELDRYDGNQVPGIVHKVL